MSNIKLDKNSILDFENRKVGKIKIFFYDSGCSGTKVDISEDFVVDENLELISFLPFSKGVPEGGEIKASEGIDVYVYKREKEKFEDCNITKTITADHTGKEKVRYIFSSNKIKDRCGCGSSFSFDKKVPKFDLNKLKDLKLNFKK
ncbi:MAG: hypothetical protein Q9M94_05945 [Candidatus Gracilibacteria bacterium]|nr:hypothetical protein [Candidatus Gracilibacteria bacterium]MDQ7022870.1 hypothetical protein [Candidatus Gracilibacteria bacterium]